MKTTPTLSILIFVGLLVIAAFYVFQFRNTSQLPSIVNQPSPDERFVWPANTTLEATEEIIVVLPGDIVADNEIIDSVIQTSSPDTRIAFDPPDGSPAFRSISLWLMPGVRLKLTKTANVRFQTPDGRSGTGESYMKVVRDP